MKIKKIIIAPPFKVGLKKNRNKNNGFSQKRKFIIVK